MSWDLSCSRSLRGEVIRPGPAADRRRKDTRSTAQRQPASAVRPHARGNDPSRSASAAPQPCGGRGADSPGAWTSTHGTLPRFRGKCCTLSTTGFRKNVRPAATNASASSSSSIGVGGYDACATSMPCQSARSGRSGVTEAGSNETLRRGEALGARPRHSLIPADNTRRRASNCVSARHGISSYLNATREGGHRPIGLPGRRGFMQSGQPEDWAKTTWTSPATCCAASGGQRPLPRLPSPLLGPPRP
jgi:hypothetical protein